MKKVTVYSRKQEALKWLALAVLKNRGKSPTMVDITIEKARIERIISDDYTKSSSDVEYNQYVLDFIKDHGRDIVFSERYDYDVALSDDHYDLNVDILIDKFQEENRRLTNNVQTV